MSQVSKKWQAEVEALNNAAATLYKNYQNEIVFLSQEQKKERRVMERKRRISMTISVFR